MNSNLKLISSSVHKMLLSDIKSLILYVGETVVEVSLSLSKCSLEGEFKMEGKKEGGREKGEKKSLNSKSTTIHLQPPAGQQS